MLIGQKLATIAQQNASKPMFRYLAKTTSYKEAYSYINRYSYFLQNEITHNKKVLVYMSNCPHLFYTFVALANTKNLAYLVDPSTPDPRVVDKINDEEVDYIIVSDDYLGRMRDLLRNNGINKPVIQCETRRWGEYDESYRLPVSQSAKEADPVCIFDTAGASGTPKMVPYSHNMIQQAALVLRSAYRSGPTDCFFSYNQSLAHPFYFIHGLMLPILSGSDVEITDLNTTEELAKELLEAKVSRVIMKPGVIYDWLNSFKSININMPLIRSITREPGPLPADFEQKLKDVSNCKILNVYGSVETCWALAARQFEEPEPFTTVGRFFPGLKTRIVDENGDDVPKNPKKPMRGQLLVSGSSVAPSYHNNKEATKLNMRGQWHFTQDVVEVDKNDIVTFLDRRDNMVKVIDQHVLPAEVEAVVNQLPGVEQCAAIAMKDPVGKMNLGVVVHRRKGIELSAQSILDHCKSALGDHHVPKAIAFMDELPLDHFGFIDKYRLRFEFNS